MPKIAVLGLGSIGMRHARNLMALGCDVTGYDPMPERRASVAGIGGQVEDNRERAIAAAEAVAVCSPNANHLDDLAAAVAAGKSSFVEKPLAHTDGGVEAILADAERRGLRVAVGFNLRHHPVVQAAKKLIDGATLGRVLWGRFVIGSYLPDWRPGSDYRRGYAADPRTGGVIFDAIHEFDLAQFLLGKADVVAAVARRTGMLDIPSEDCADALLRHAGGAVSSIHLDYVTRPPVRGSEIAFERGFARLDLIGRRFVVAAADNTIIADESFLGSDADDYVSEMREFLACLSGQGRPTCDGREGLAVLRLALGARRLAALPE